MYHENVTQLRRRIAREYRDRPLCLWHRDQNLSASGAPNAATASITVSVTAFHFRRMIL